MVYTLQKDLYEYQTETIKGFQYTLGTMLRMMWTQATGVPSGNHGMFHRYHIEAVTLEGVRRKKTGKVGIETTGRYGNKPKLLDTLRS